MSLFIREIANFYKYTDHQIHRSHKTRVSRGAINIKFYRIMAEQWFYVVHFCVDFFYFS